MTMYSWIFLTFCWLSKGPGKHGGRWQQERSMVGQCHSYLEFMTKQIELLFNHFIIWIGSICYFKLTFGRIIVTTLACFVTCCPHENDWHVFHKYLFQKNLNHNLSNYFWMNKVKMLIHSTFLRITMITDWVLLNLFFIWTGLAWSFKFTLSKKS